MGIEVEIIIPGKTSALEDALLKWSAGDLSPNKLAAIQKRADQIGDSWRLSNYCDAWSFADYIINIAKKEKNQYTKYVARVLYKMNDITLHYDEVLVFKQGLSMIEKLLPADMNPEYREVFSRLKKTIARYLKINNKKAVIRFG